MSVLSPLAEYLLAWQYPKGNKLCRMGAVSWTIPVIPPGMAINFDILPYYNAQMDIYVWGRWSPSIVPDALFFETSTPGTVFISGVLTSTSLAQEHNLWIEVTTQSPIHTRVINLSPVAQYFDSGNVFLSIGNTADLELIRKVIDGWNNQGVRSLIESTNMLLENGLTRGQR